MQENLTNAFNAALGRIAPSSLKAQLRADFEEQTNLIAADPANTPAATAAMARLLAIANQSRSPLDWVWSIGMLLLIFASLGLFACGIAEYFARIPSGELTNIASARPILVLTLIIAMLGFGGLLISRPLFMGGTAQEIGDKFKLSREIFLVFSGVFATVIGFYFGSTTGTTERLPASRFNIAAPQVSPDGRITLTASGPDAPYDLQWKENPTALDSSKKKDGIYSIALNAAIGCPSTITLTGANKAGEAVPDTTVSISREVLAANKWDQCKQVPAPGGTPPVAR